MGPFLKCLGRGPVRFWLVNGIAPRSCGKFCNNKGLSVAGFLRQTEDWLEWDIFKLFALFCQFFWHHGYGENNRWQGNMLPLYLGSADTQRQAHQDRSQSGQPFLLRDISDGGSGCAADALTGNLCLNPAVAFFDNTCEAGMMCGTPENRVLEWRARVAVCQNSGKKLILHTNTTLFLCLMRHGVLNLPESR